jgi:hypothetical protein
VHKRRRFQYHRDTNKERSRVRDSKWREKRALAAAKGRKAKPEMRIL